MAEAVAPDLTATEAATVGRFETTRRVVQASALVLGVAGVAVAGTATVWIWGGPAPPDAVSPGPIAAEGVPGFSGLGEYADVVAGTAGALWALAGVLLVYVAFVGQRVQLVYQQAELRATRAEFTQQSEELAGQREEMERQGREARRQTFDAAFFQRVRLHNEVLHDLVVAVGGEGLRGRRAFAALHRDLVLRYEAGLSGRLSPGSGGELEVALDAYKALHAEHAQDLGTYFGTLYHALRFVDDADDAVVEDKRALVNVVRAQLSTAETAALACYALARRRGRMKALVERYSLLKHMAPGPVADAVRSGYGASAFARDGAGRTGPAGEDWWTER